MFGIKNRRKVSNIVVDSRALFRFSIPFLILIIIGITIVILIHRQVLDALAQADTTNENAGVLMMLQQTVSSVMETGMIGTFVLGLACLTLWIVYSHRIFGPSVPIRRHVQSLIDGNYKSRIQLRSGDEFGDLAKDLNQLAENLEARRSEK